MGNAPSQPTSSRSRVNELNEKYNTLSSNLSTLTLSESEPTSADGSLSLENVSQWEDKASSDPKLKLARTILAHSNIRQALTNREAYIEDKHVFNTEIDFNTGTVTNQKSSGRCWLFATTNVLRYEVMKKLKLKEFQLSQSYLFFWDKLNKSNYYLELAIKHADKPLDDQLVYHLSGDLVSDGGQWDMVVNLLEIYGMVPQSIHPESTHSSLSSPLNSLVKTKLREHALTLRKLHDSLRSSYPTLSAEAIHSTLRSKKESLLGEIYTIMSATLGVVPSPDKEFVWEYYEDGVGGCGKVKTWKGTPKDFYKAFGGQYKPSDCFSLINDPRNEYQKLYTVDSLGNIWGGRPILYVNTDISDLKNAIVKMIKAGQPVFFGCDVGQFSDRDTGIMDTSLFAYEDAFNIKLRLTKAQRLQTHESAMTHAMVISGVHLDSAGKPVRYKVENSWGEDAGNKGYFVMTDRWFDEFVFQVVVPKALAPKNLVQVYESGEMVVLPAWDPMGALA